MELQRKIHILEGVAVITSHYRESAKCRERRRVDDKTSGCFRCDVEDWLIELRSELLTLPLPANIILGEN